MARTRLNIDWDAMFPGDSLEICGTTIVIRPLGLLALSSIAKQLKGFGSLIAEDNVTWENYGTPDNIVKVAAVLLDKFPGILAEASNIEEEDIAQLPIDEVVSILNKVLEVNLKSKDALEKNFLSLAEKFQTLMQSQK